MYHQIVSEKTNTATDREHYTIKDAPDALPIKGMSLTATASSQEEAVAQAISLYINDFNGAAALRAQLMETNNLEEVEKIISDFKKHNTI